MQRSPERPLSQDALVIDRRKVLAAVSFHRLAGFKPFTDQIGGSIHNPVVHAP
jgi:hypothetical protein